MNEDIEPLCDALVKLAEKGELTLDTSYGKNSGILPENADTDPFLAATDPAILDEPMDG